MDLATARARVQEWTSASIDGVDTPLGVVPDPRPMGEEERRFLSSYGTFAPTHPNCCD